jgi:hypothetical protein
MIGTLDAHREAAELALVECARLVAVVETMREIALAAWAKEPAGRER